ncbi:MAG TPA: NHL repeat-containing protein [Solirubrobacterales bacterium]|nr:NHL repeat-containing protein [Solirubrobacterales bacterium]
MRSGLRATLLAAAVLAAMAFPGSAMAFGLLSSFGSYGEGPGQLRSPEQIAFAADGTSYIADSGNNRISVFSSAGIFLRAFGEGVAPGGGDVCTAVCRAGTAGASAGQMQEPEDVALDGSGRVFVADHGNNRVDVFATEGTFLFAFGKDVNGTEGICTTVCDPGALEPAAGAIASPTGVAVDGSTVFVASGGNDRIDVFATAGEFLRSSGPTSSPKDVIVGSNGSVYVADSGNDRVDIFTRQGTLIESFGDKGAGQLSGPVSLAAEGEEIYVADQGAQRIERFSASGGYLGGFPTEPGLAGVGLACEDVFAVEGAPLSARVERFGEPGAPTSPPCLDEPPVAIEAPVKPPSNRFRFAGLLKNRGNGSAVLFARVPGPGRVILYGRGVRRLVRGARQAKRVRLPVRPKVPLKRFLKEHGKGRIRVEVTFEPTGGVPSTLEKVIVLRRRRA